MNLEWLQAHWDELQSLAVAVMAFIGAAYGVARIVVYLTPTPEDDRYLEQAKAWFVQLCKITGLDPRQGRNTPLIMLLCAALAMGAMGGCVTTTTTAPDGTVTETRTTDTATLTVVAQLVNEALDRIQATQQDQTLTEEERAARLEAQQMRYQMLLELLQTLKPATAPDTAAAVQE